MSKEDELRSVLDALPRAAIATDLQGTVTLWNRGAEVLYGWSAEEAIGRSVLELTPSEMSAEQAEAIMAALGGGGIWRGSFGVQRKDGSGFVAFVEDVPITGPDGALTGVLGLSVPVEGSTPPEEVLHLRSKAADTSRDGIVIVDMRGPDMPIIEVNVGFERMTGYARDEVLGRNCRFLQGDGTSRETVSRMREAIRAREPFVDELLNYRKDGTPFWNLLRLVPMTSVDGTREYFLGVQTDVTELRQAREREERARRVLLTEQLKGDFLATVSHEMRTPMSGILGGLELLKTATSSETGLELVALVQRNAVRLQTMLEKLLLLSSASAGTLPVANDETSVDEILHRLSERHRAMLSERGSELSTARSGGAPARVTTDVELLESILDEVVTNAIVHGGGAAVRVRVDRVDENHWSVTVEDDGPGVAAELAASIFAPFEQGTTGNTRTPGGVGVGLAIAAKLATLLGGRLELARAGGRGAAFRLTLPNEPFDSAGGSWSSDGAGDAAE